MIGKSRWPAFLEMLPWQPEPTDHIKTVGILLHVMLALCFVEKKKKTFNCCINFLIGCISKSENWIFVHKDDTEIEVMDEKYSV